MGRIAELFEKKAQGKISEEELKELDTLQKEAQALNENPKTDPKEDNEDEDAAVEELAQKLADSAAEKIQSGIQSGMDKVMKTFEDRNPQVTVTHEAKFIFDPKLGKKSVEELSHIMVPVPGRENKKVKEVSQKTVHFVHALMNSDVAKLQLLLEGTGSRGGYLVPEEFSNMIVEDVRDRSVMRQLASQMTIQGDTLHLPALANRPKANWRAEAAVKATSTVDFAEQVFTPYSLAVIVGLSNELAADASLGVNGSIVNYVAGLMATSIAEKEEQAFWEGDGSGKPTGIDAYTLRLVASGGSDANRADALIAAYHRTPQGYRNRAVWAMNSATIEAIARVKDTNGNYLLSSLAAGPTMTLRGRPVYEQNDLPGGKAFFGDFSYYQIVDREGISTRISDEATVGGSSAFEKNLTFVRVEKRVDAELTLPAAITEVTGLGSP